MLLRAAAQAALAFLLGGTLATRGWSGLLRPWDWAVPYLAGFLALELLLRRREAGAARVFALGAAFAFLYEGVYAKSVLDGLGPLGVETGALAAACFDWGMLAVMASHLLSRRFPRASPLEGPGWLAALPAGGVLAFLGVCMAAVYLVKTWFGHYVAERALGPAWLVADLLLAYAAWRLGRRVLDADPAEPPRWQYALCAFAVCAPGAHALSTWADAFSWTGPVLFIVEGSWVAACAWGFWRLWRWRGVVDETPARESRLVLYAAAWRVVGSAVILLAANPAVFDERAAAAYAALVDLPSRALFAYAFLTSRLDV